MPKIRQNQGRIGEVGLEAAQVNVEEDYQIWVPALAREEQKAGAGKKMTSKDGA